MAKWKNILVILIFPHLGTSEMNRSIWREMNLVSFLIYIMILPNKNLYSIDFFELSKNIFIEKRKKCRQQLLVFR